jgi:predicted nucleotide-binding protein (sugar kinase/HSP70/actin superfamily)
MDIRQLAKKPELVEVVLDSESIVKEYGEPITFWMKDFVDINTYFEFFRSQQEKSGNDLNKLLAKLILNKEGTPVLNEEETFPIDITIEALTKINETLGKSKTKSLIQSNGTQPE